jgi:sulfatase maturation enzyme AslB (radical SAM superfamily)
MNLSINPWYYCNFRCHFCYLTPEQLGDRKLLDLERLNEMLSEVMMYDSVDHVDLYGGEIALLPDYYLEELKLCLESYGIDSVNINTNLSAINEAMFDPYYHISVSYDFAVREQHDKVWRNMALLPVQFSVLMLASDRLITEDVDNMIQQFNLLPNLTSVEIKPYSENQSNSLNVSFKDYEEFVKQWIASTVEKKFDFINEYLIQDVLDKKGNSFSDDHVYITPNGRWAVLEFDLNDKEYFLEYDSFDQYLVWTRLEKERVANNKFCNSCEYYGHCLSEHLREVKDLDNSCNGFKLLIDWYANRSN